MDLRANINGYFEKTPIPAELAPEKISGFVKPRTAAKKPVNTADETDKGASEAVILKDAEENPNPAAQSDFQPSASLFIKIVFHHKLTRSEFLSLLGNSKISNNAYQEIKDNPDLTVKRLIEILEDSPLTSDDYNRLIIAVQRTVQLKEEAKEKIISEAHKPVAAGNAERISAKPKIDLTSLTPEKTMEVPSPAPKAKPAGQASAASPFDNGAPDDEEDDADGKKPSRRKMLFGKNKDDYDDSDTDDDESDDEDEEFDDEDEDIGVRKRSNKGKFIAAAIGAITIIAISFGLRYYFTGSILPYPENNNEEAILDEEGIFDALSYLPEQSINGLLSKNAYTVGGVVSEKTLKNVITTERRLIYIHDNSLYIFELIGGQAEQLEIRKYPPEIKILGMADTGKGIAVVSSYEGDDYTFSYKQSDVSQGEDENSSPDSNGKVKRPETVIELLNPDSPENRGDIKVTRLSGILSELYVHDNRIIAITAENFAEGSVKEEYASFMPYISTSDGKQLCSSENFNIEKNPSYCCIAAVFSIEPDGDCIMAASAGDRTSASLKTENKLFIGQGSTILRYDISEGISENGSCTVDGSFSDFSAINVSGDEIRATTITDGAAALLVLDAELNIKSEVKNIGNGEKPSASCFNAGETYIITESGSCYGIDKENNVISESGIKITSAKIYPFNNSLGIKVTPTDDGGKRTGILVSTVKNDGTMSEISSSLISSLTVAKNARDEYLSSPAETDIFTIGSEIGENGSGTAVVPSVYFDGVSEVELFVIYSINAEGIISINGSISEYDRNSKNIFALVKGNYVIAVTESRIVTARTEDGSIVGYFDVSASASSEYTYNA